MTTQKITFDKTQEKSGVNKFGHYQFGANCCIGCKKDRPLTEKGEWCEICLNYQSTPTFINGKRQYNK